MPYDIQVRLRQTQSMVSSRRTTKPEDIAATLAEALQAVYAYVARAGAKPSGPPFTIYHAVAQGEMIIEAGVPTELSLPGDERVTSGWLQDGRVATTTHVGGPTTA